ncbi:MAG TPA: hypothetical protein VNG32_03825 [Candidatus Dormibacteraeota bacterium]|nr:hypothetical protein [Candidatus Dormibacteraeota bacterium]
MKFGTREGRVGIFREIAARKQLLGEEAARYPLGREAYKDLPVTERMQLAERLVDRYSPQGEDAIYGKYETPGSHRQKASAELEMEDHPGMLLRGKLLSAVHTSNDRRLTGLFVMARAVDPAVNLMSHSIPYGAVLPGGRMVIDPDWNWDGTVVLAEDPEAANVVAMIDEATVGLIEGVVRDHRRYIGQQAVSEVPSI